MLITDKLIKKKKIEKRRKEQRIKVYPKKRSTRLPAQGKRTGYMDR